MKKIGILLIVLLLTCHTWAQSLSSDAISNGGGYESNAGSTWSYTIGELAIDYYTGSTSLACGFQQSFQDLMRKVMLTLLLEGLYDGASMRKAQNASGDQYPGNVADRISVSLRHPAPPFDNALTVNEVDLKQDGTAEFSVDLTFNAEYFIVINNRNHLETWTASPLAFSGNTIVYDFTQAVANAYGSNMKDMGEGRFVFFAGDANHDGSINETDIDMLTMAATGFQTGYIDQDINGDRVIDALDLILTDNNAAATRMVLRP
jgi:hypothetical protein